MDIAEYLKRNEDDPRFIVSGLVHDVAGQLYTLMLNKGLTKKTLAEKAGLCPTTLDRLFQAEHDFTLTTIGKLCAALEVRPQLFFEDKERCGLRFEGSARRTQRCNEALGRDFRSLIHSLTNGEHVGDPELVKLLDQAIKFYEAHEWDRDAWIKNLSESSAKLND